MKLNPIPFEYLIFNLNFMSVIDFFSFKFFIKGF